MLGWLLASVVFDTSLRVTPASVADASPSGTLTTALTNPATASLRTVPRVMSGDCRIFHLP